MPFSPGEKLSPYELGAPIGKGGMGEVWKAHDPRLNRDVAIKVSAEQFSERLARQIGDALEAAHEKGITHRDLQASQLKVNAYCARVLIRKAPTRNVGAFRVVFTRFCYPAILVPGLRQECMRAAVYRAKAHDLARIIDSLSALEIPA